MYGWIWKALGVLLPVMNIGAFAAMGIDKRRAVKDKWRIPEKTLFLWAALGGAWGALIGMKVFRHKTKKLFFRIAFPFFCIVQTAGLLALAYYTFNG